MWASRHSHDHYIISLAHYITAVGVVVSLCKSVLHGYHRKLPRTVSRYLHRVAACAAVILTLRTRTYLSPPSVPPPFLPIPPPPFLLLPPPPSPSLLTTHQQVVFPPMAPQWRCSGRSIRLCSSPTPSWPVQALSLPSVACSSTSSSERESEQTPHFFVLTILIVSFQYHISFQYTFRSFPCPPAH